MPLKSLGIYCVSIESRKVKNLKSQKSKNDAGLFIRDIVFGTNDALLTNIGIITGFTASLVASRLIAILAYIRK